MSQRKVRVSHGSELEDREVIGEDRIPNDVCSAFQEGVRHEEGVSWRQAVGQTSFLTLLGGEGGQHSKLE